jgi:hypothetical protein
VVGRSVVGEECGWGGVLLGRSVVGRSVVGKECCWGGVLLGRSVVGEECGWGGVWLVTLRIDKCMVRNFSVTISLVCDN